jgi:poly(3-hydroxybutyrate) depolymerase
LWQYRWIVSNPKGRLGWCALLVLLLMACSGGKTGKSLPPLAAASWHLELPVKGFGPASVSVPLAATTPRPIVVVLHGALDRADWQCGSFRGVLGGHVFVLCPQGIAGGAAGRFTFGSVDDTSAELRAALAALKERFGKHVAPSPVVLIGYAEGAALAVELARQEPSFFARVALVQGEPTVFSPTAATVFAQRGGKRALFFCTNATCDDSAVSRALILQRARVEAKAVRKDVGPYLDERFTAALAPEVSWLLEGDARFKR